MSAGPKGKEMDRAEFLRRFAPPADAARARDSEALERARARRATGAAGALAGPAQRRSAAMRSLLDELDGY